MKVFVVFLVLAAGGWIATLSAQELVHFDAANAPFMFQKDEKAAGLYPNLFREAFTRMGVKVTLDALPWKRALSETNDGIAGIGGIYQNADRLTRYDFSEPYYQERIGIYVLVGKEFKFESMADLSGKSLGVLKGWSYGDEYDAMAKSGKIRSDDGATSDRLNFEKLSAGRNDGVISVLESGESAIKTLRLEGKVVLLPRFLAVNKVYLAFAKSAKKTKLLAEFDKVMAGMKKDGTFASIVSASFGE